jgi:hypothetical protein
VKVITVEMMPSVRGLTTAHHLQSRLENRSGTMTDVAALLLSNLCLDKFRQES